MPINLQPQAIRAALAAGKHVISEKPVADTVAHAKALVADYEALPSKPIWAVAENYRYMQSLQLAEAKLREIGGDLVSFSLVSNKFVRPDGNYFNTAWRKNPTHPGGFLLDGGIHYVAALRALLGAAGGGGGGNSEQSEQSEKNKITKVAGTMTQLLEILPPADTIRNVAFTKGGVTGVVTMSFGTEFGPPLDISVTTTEGMVTWRMKSVTVTTRNAENQFQPHEAVLDCSEANPAFPADEATGVKAEFAAFAASIVSGKNTVDPRQSPAEALEDLLLLEAMFETGAAGGEPKTIA
jgi:predicted dehydrogenase